MGAEAEPGGAVPGALLLTGARLADGRAVDVRLSGDRIEAVGAAGSLSAAERLDLSGYLLLPAPVEAHAHLDEALTAGGTPSPPTDAGAAARAGVDEADAGAGAPDEEDLRRRITEAALTYLGSGSTAVRTHVLVSDATGLTRLDAALQAARDLRGLMDLQVVAMPGRLTGERTGDPGHVKRALLREAARAGVHALGGRPGAEPVPKEALAVLLELAHACDLPLDLHLDSPTVVDLTRLTGLTGPAAPSGPASVPSTATASTASTAPGRAALLGALPPGSVLTIAGALSPSGLAALVDAGLTGAGLTDVARSGPSAVPRFGVVVLPQGGCCAGPHGPAGYDAATARALAGSGIPLAAGSGALRDAVRPVGRADPIEAAFLLAATTGLAADAAYDAVAAGARELLGLPRCAVEPGRPAELLALRGESLAAALSGGHSRVVLHAGRVVSRTSAVREYAETTPAAVPRQVRPPGPA